MFEKFDIPDGLLQRHVSASRPTATTLGGWNSDMPQARSSGEGVGL
jgi:hypothetical protein